MRRFNAGNRENREAQILQRTEERAKQRQDQFDKRTATRTQRFNEKSQKKLERDTGDLNKRLAKLAEVRFFLVRFHSFQDAFC